MPADEWAAFHAQAREILNRADAEVWADAEYSGAWEGVAEDAVILYGAIEDDSIPDVRDALGRLAGDHDQDAIGVAVGEPGLARPPALTELGMTASSDMEAA